MSASSPTPASAARRSYGSGARILSIGIASTGVLTLAYFSISSHVLSEEAAAEVALLWSVMFVIISVIYRPTEQLIESGLIQESGRRPVAELDDERRRYYKLTAFGRRVVAAEAARLDDLVAAARAHKLLPHTGRA